MRLSDEQRTVLAELINVGVGKAAAILSSMISQKIQIRVPVVDLIPIRELATDFAGKLGDGGVGVSIDFAGDFSGNTTLVFGRQAGKTLVDQLLAVHGNSASGDGWDDTFGDSQTDDEFNDIDKEAIIELGNMMINALMGTMSQLLDTVFAYKPPVLNLAMNFAELYPSSECEVVDRYAIILRTDFKAEEGGVQGYLALVFELTTSIASLIAAIDRIIARDAAEGDF